METKLFEILVYNRSPKEFNQYWENQINKYRREESDIEWKSKFEIYKHIKGRKTRWYNSVIGYISIVQSNIDLITMLSIDVREKKYLEGNSDIYYDPSTFSRTRTNKNMASNEILESFNTDLESACKHRLKNRYIDFEAWHNFSTHIDWHQLFYPQAGETYEDMNDNISDEERIMREHLPFDGKIQTMPDETF